MLKMFDCSLDLITRITDRYKLPRGCWELNLGPLQEHQALLRNGSLMWDSPRYAEILGSQDEQAAPHYIAPLLP